MNSEHPPEEPHLRSEPALLSPASPKPIYFPAPTNIPILDKMMDVGFNQTEAHMADPAMHNTELRQGAWQDPDAPNEAANEESMTDVKPETVNVGQQQGASDAAQSVPISQSTDTTDVAATQPEAPIDSSALIAEPAAHHAALSSQSTKFITTPSTATPFGNVDVQTLLNTLNAASVSTPAANVAPAGESLTIATTLSPSTSQAQPRVPGLDSSPISVAGLGAPPTGLPPRPPPQDQPLINSNYAHTQHIRDYHPHAANPALAPRNSTTGAAGDASARNFVPPVASAASPSAANAIPTAQSPTTAAAQDQQRAMWSANHRHQGTPLESRREYKIAQGLNLDEEDKPWTKDTQTKYDKFIEDERKYVSEGRWEQFPYGSRLFVGNLSSEKVTKRDIFHVFHVYGDLAQISIKQAYGFVQFLRPQDCANALVREEGKQIRDKKIHLEVSKPQRNRPQAHDQSNQYNARRRSRSPDYNRGGGRQGGGRGDYGNGRDRDRERDRNGYQGYRSPSPRRDSHRDRYRDRSPPSYSRGNRGGRAESPDDDLPLPRRAPQNVPDVQILVLDALNRDFIAWVQHMFEARGLRVEMLILSPRLDPEQVIRRQLLEGVLAVCRLNRTHQDSGRINLRVFNRSAGLSNVTYDDYDNQDPQICVELALRAKQTQPPPMQQQYGGYQPPQYMPPQQQQQQYGYNAPPVPAAYPASYGAPQQQHPPPTAQQPDLQQLITSLDPKGLQSLLSAMGSNGAPTPHTVASYGTPQSAQQYAGYGAPAPQQQNFAGQQQTALNALQSNPASFAGLLQQQQQMPHQNQQAPQQQMNGNGSAPQQVDMAQILARLGTYGQK